MNKATKGWVNSIVTDALMVGALYMAYNGRAWAENALAFWVLGVGTISTLLCLAIVITPTKVLADVSVQKGLASERRVGWETFAGLVFALTFAAFGWFGMATIKVVSTLAFGMSQAVIRNAKVREAGA